MASDRDRQAAQLRHAGLSYEQIIEWLGFTDRRAAHRGVARGLAEPAVDEAMIRGLAVRNMDARLQHVQHQMFAWLEQAEPHVLETLEGRAFFKVLDAMVRVSVQRCRLHGMVVHPHRGEQAAQPGDVPQEFLSLNLGPVRDGGQQCGGGNLARRRGRNRSARSGAAVTGLPTADRAEPQPDYSAASS